MDRYIPFYPDPDNPPDDIQRIISSKREFRDLIPPVGDEKPPLPGQRYIHQEFFIRYMNYANRVLCIYEAGTGKSCAFIGVAEHLIRTGQYSRCIIFEIGDTLGNEMRRQIAEHCNEPGRYTQTPGGPHAKSEKSRLTAIKARVKENYDIVNYAAFARSIKSKSDDEIIKLYSSHVLVLDEVHTMTSLKPERFGAARDAQDDGFDTYNQIKRLIRLARNTKVILASATPMVNNVKQIVKIMNLILPEDNQMSESDVETPTIENLKRFFNGRIAYIKSTRSESYPLFVGVPIFQDKSSSGEVQEGSTIVYPTVMGDIQRRKYQEKIRESHGKDAFQTRAQGICVLAVPDGFKDYDDVIKRKPELFSDLASLSRYSGKVSKIVEIETTELGCSFIYTDKVKDVGSDMLSKIFELYGFSVITGDMKVNAIMAETAEPKPRVAVYSSSSKSNGNSAILTVFNSEKNVMGEYIKCFIGSRITRDGINLRNCLRVHLLYSTWHHSGDTQSIWRAIRVKSHQNMIKHIKEQQTKIPGNLMPLSFRSSVPVRVYRHVAVFSKDKIDDVPTVDISKYYKAELKEMPIRAVYNIMKRLAVDCSANRNRNISGDAKDYSLECDYRPCKYECYSVPSREVDDRSVSIYIPKMIVEASEKLKVILSRRGYINVDQVQGTSVDIVRKALIYLIKNKTQIKDMYGMPKYVATNGTIAFLVEEVAANGDFPVDEVSLFFNDLSYYSDKLFLPASNTDAADNEYTLNMLFSNRSSFDISRVSSALSVLCLKRVINEAISRSKPGDPFEIGTTVTSVSMPYKSILASLDRVDPYGNDVLSRKIIGFYKRCIFCVRDHSGAENILIRPSSISRREGFDSIPLLEKVHPGMVYETRKRRWRSSSASEDTQAVNAIVSLMSKFEKYGVYGVQMLGFKFKVKSLLDFKPGGDKRAIPRGTDISNIDEKEIVRMFRHVFTLTNAIDTNNTNETEYRRKIYRGKNVSIEDVIFYNHIGTPDVVTMKTMFHDHLVNAGLVFYINVDPE